MNRKLRVVQLVPSLDMGGVETLRESFARQLAGVSDFRELVEVRFCALAAGGMVARTLTALGFDVAVLGGNAHPLNLLTTARLARYLRRNPADILHSAVLEANVHGALARRLAGVPVAVSDEQGLGWRRPRWVRAMSAVAHRAATCVIACSESVKADLVRHEGVPASRVRVIYNGAEVFAADPGDRAAFRREIGCPADTPVVGCIGRLVEEKNYPVVLDAFARVAEKAPRAHLVIAGDGPERERLLGRVAALELTRCAHVVGWVPRAGVARALAAFDVFVLASSIEGFSVALVEAMLAGLPVVATAVAGNPEAVTDGETGILVPVGDPEALAAAILRYFDDPDRAREMAQRGRAAATHRFTAEHYARELVQLYVALAGSEADRGRRGGE